MTKHRKSFDTARESESATSENVIERYYVLDDGEPVKVHLYKDGTPKSSFVTRFDNGAWAFIIDNDYINVGVEEKFKKNKVTPADYKKAVTAYHRHHTPSGESFDVTP